MKYSSITHSAQLYLLASLSVCLTLMSNTQVHAKNLALEIPDQKTMIHDGLNIEPMDISGVVIQGDIMVLVSDETNAIEILKQNKSGQWQSYSRIQLSDKIAEIDLEGLAWQPPYLYALGSHSAKRKRLKSKAMQKQNMKRLQQTYPEKARQKLFRITLDNKLNVTAIDSLSLQPALEEHPILQRFIRIPSKENGIDMEGLAIDTKGRLLIGLRGPILRGNIASVLRVELNKSEFAIKKTKAFYVPTQGGGIRGISEMGKDFLVLTGAVGDQIIPYQTYKWNGKNALPGEDTKENTWQNLCALPSTKGKPEGIQFLSKTKHHVEFMIVQDGIKNGGMTRFRCKLK